jgi:hypothetical protein
MGNPAKKEMMDLVNFTNIESRVESLPGSSIIAYFNIIMVPWERRRLAGMNSD